MAKTGAERSAKAAAKRIQYDEKELRHRCRLGTRQTLETLMDWTDDTEQASVIEASLRYVHSLGQEGARKALNQRHKIEISENVAREFHNQSLMEIRKDPGDEIIAPRLVSFGLTNPSSPCAKQVSQPQNILLAHGQCRMELPRRPFGLNVARKFLAQGIASFEKVDNAILVFLVTEVD